MADFILKEQVRVVGQDIVYLLVVLNFSAVHISDMHKTFTVQQKRYKFTNWGEGFYFIY